MANPNETIKMQLDVDIEPSFRFTYVGGMSMYIFKSNKCS